MQPQRREVRVENNEYEREQQRLAKQIKRVVVLRNDHIFAFCAVWKRAHFLELFQLCLLTLFTLRCTCITDRPKSTCHSY